MVARSNVGGVTLELQMELRKYTGETRKATSELKAQVNEQKRVLKDLARETERTHDTVVKNFGKMARAATTLQTSLVAVGGGFAGISGAQSFVRLADQFTNIQSKLQGIAGSQAEVNRLFEQLSAIANKSGASLEDTTKSFQDLQSLQRDLGATNQEFLRLTDIVGKLGRIGGATTAQMSNGMLGLTQALASGKVQADEFRQINDNLPQVANQIARTMGMTRGELRALVKDGKITSEQLFKALMDSGETVDRRFKSVSKTVAASLTEIQNTLIETAGKLDQSTGVTKKLADAFGGLSQMIKNAGKELVKFNETALTTKAGNNVKISDVMGAAWKAGGEAMKGFDPNKGVSNYVSYEFRKGGKMGGDLYLPILERMDRARQVMDAELSKLDKPKVRPVMGPFATADQLADERDRVAARNKAPGPSDEFLKKLEKEQKLVADIVAKRQEEALELRQKNSGMDNIAIIYDREVREIKATVLSTKEKRAAIEQLTKAYAELKKQTKIEETLKQQKEQEKSADSLRKKLNDRVRLTEEQVKGQRNLNEALKLEAEYRELISKGNKGSQRVQDKFDALGQQVEQAKSDAIGRDAVEVYKDLNEDTAKYKENLSDITAGLRDNREELERRLRGEEDISSFVRARRDVEEKTAETLKKQREALEVIDALLAKDAGNTVARERKLKIESDITQSYKEREETLRAIDQEQKLTLEANKALKEQQNLLQDIVKSTKSYTEKVQELTAAFDSGKITAEQYGDALRDIKEKAGKASESAKGLLGSVSGGLMSILRGQKSVSEGFKQMGIDLGNFAAKRFLLQPMEKMLGRMLDNFFGGMNLFGRGGSLGGIAGKVAAKAGGSLAAGLASGVTPPALAASTPSAVTKPVASLPLALADPSDVQLLKKPELDKAEFTLPMFRGARLPIATFYEGKLPSAYFENSRHKDDDFFKSYFRGALFDESSLGRGFFKSSWFDTSQFRKPLLDGATIKNATIQASSTTGAGFSGGAGGILDGVSKGIFTGLLLRLLPGFASGGNYSAGGHGLSLVGEQGPELFFPGQSGYVMNNQMSQMFMALQSLFGGLFGGFGGGGGLSIPGRALGEGGGIATPWQQTNVYAGGANGYSGNGMISQLDNSRMLTGLYRDKYNSGLQAVNSGALNAPSWYTLREIDYHAQRHANIVANNGVTGQLFSRSQFESASAWAEANEASYMWGGQRNDPRRYLNPMLWGEYDPSARMRGWASTGLVDTNFGSGSEGLFVNGGIARNISNTAPLNSNRASAFSNPFNGGDLRSASQLGSYLTALLGGGGYTSPGASRGAPYNPFANPWGLKPIGIDPNTGEMGKYGYDPRTHFPSGWVRGGATDLGPMPGFSPQFDQNGRVPRPGGGYMQWTPNGIQQFDRFGKAITLGATVLPMQAVDKFDVRSVFADENRSYGGNVVYGPWMPSTQSANYGQREMAKAIYGGILGSTVKRFGRGGKFRKDEPFVAGDMGGPELVWPDSAGSVVPNHQLQRAMKSEVKVNVINQTGVKVTATVRTNPDGSADVIMRAITNAAADPSHPLHKQIKNIARSA